MTDSSTQHRKLVQGWNSKSFNPTPKVGVSHLDTEKDGSVLEDTVSASVFTSVLNTFAESPQYWESHTATQQHALELATLNERSHALCKLGSHIGIKDGVDTSAVTTYECQSQPFQVCHTESNMGGPRNTIYDKGLLPSHDVNFTKHANLVVTKLWEEEANECAKQVDLLEEHIRITWHNVNGIAGFIDALSLNSDGYFLSGLIPDIFGILEAKVCEQDPNTQVLIRSLETLLFRVTREKYYTVQSLRGSQLRCGTVLFLRVKFLQLRQWWTWMGDLNPVQPAETWEETGYAFNPDRHSLNEYNEWKRGCQSVSDGDGRVIQLILGPKMDTLPRQSTFARFRLIVVYVRNSSSGDGDPTARINFDRRLHEVAAAPSWLPTAIVGDTNVSPSVRGVISPSAYRCDPTKLTGFLPHEIYGHKRLTDSGFVTNTTLDLEWGVICRPAHNAGGMAAYDGIRHYMQIFDLNRLYLNQPAKELYVLTLYRSLSVLGEPKTQHILGSIRSQKLFTMLCYGSDHVPQTSVLREPKDIVCPASTSDCVPNDSRLSLRRPDWWRMYGCDKEVIHCKNTDKKLISFMRIVQSAKVWFLLDGQLLCFERTESLPHKRQYDTFGGMLELQDQGSYANCVLREVDEEVKLPAEWITALTTTVRKYPYGHKYVEFTKGNFPWYTQTHLHQVAMWVVRISSRVVAYGCPKDIQPSTWAVPDSKYIKCSSNWGTQEQQWALAPVHEVVVLTLEGMKEACADSLMWRPVLDVVDNLKKFQSLQVIAKELEPWLRNPSCTQKLLSLVCMHDVLQEAAYAMSFSFESDEARTIWAGLGLFDDTLRVVTAGYKWVLRLSLFKRWAAVSKTFAESLQFRQIKSEVAILYRYHRAGEIETLCVQQLKARDKMLGAMHGLDDNCLFLQRILTERLGKFSTLYMLNTKQDPNRTDAAWLVGSGFLVPVGLKKPAWQGLFQIARPGVQLRNADYGISEKATQNHIQDSQYWQGRFRSLDAGPVEHGPIVGLRRQPGQNGGRSGVEYSSLGVGIHYMDSFIPTLHLMGTQWYLRWL